jgi:hypothetical protein
MTVASGTPRLSKRTGKKKIVTKAASFTKMYPKPDAVAL